MADRIRTWVLLVIGTGTLIYALIPPLDPGYVGVAGSLLGVGPLIAGSKEAPHHDQA